MEALKEMIIEKGKVIDGKIIKVDSFINHQIDVELLNEIGNFLSSKFKNENQKITKILTIETSGIAYAISVSQHLGNIPVVFAKKNSSSILSDDCFDAQIFSYTKNKTFNVKVDKRFLSSDDNVLIIDDFLANCEASLGLIKILNDAKATVVGVGVVIEKGFQEGRLKLEKLGVKVISCVTVEKVLYDSLIFKNN